MINLLCKACVNTCKQDESVKIINCPKFRKNPSEKEFGEMLDDLDSAEKNVKNIRKRVKGIISKTFSENSDKPSENENDINETIKDEAID